MAQMWKQDKFKIQFSIEIKRMEARKNHSNKNIQTLLYIWLIDQTSVEVW